MSLVVIIPTKTARSLIPCAEAVWTNEDPRTPIVVVDDGLVPANEEHRQVFMRWDRENCPLWIGGEKPFIFARNVNKGIRKAGNADLVILNDDALLQTPGGLTAMQRTAEEHPEFGLIAAATNVTGYPEQRPKGVGLRVTDTVAFVCVLIPRRTIDLVGLLDERFVTYGGEDVDYCLRVRKAGLKVGVFDGCFVDHSSLPSTFRGAAPGNCAPGDIGSGIQIFVDKWGSWGL